MSDCPKCGAPFEEEVIDEAVFDEDGELISEPEIDFVPQCDCSCNWKDLP